MPSGKAVVVSQYCSARQRSQKALLIQCLPIDICSPAFLGYHDLEALHALRRGTVKLRAWVPRYRPTHATEHEKVRAVIAALAVLGTQLKKAA